MIVKRSRTYALYTFMKPSYPRLPIAVFHKQWGTVGARQYVYVTPSHRFKKKKKSVGITFSPFANFTTSNNYKSLRSREDQLFLPSALPDGWWPDVNGKVGGLLGLYSPEMLPLVYR